MIRAALEAFCLLLLPCTRSASIDMDPLTTVGTGLGLLASKDLLLKLLGPSADYLGGRGKDLVEKADENLCGIFEKAWKKLGAAIDEPGAVNPRVLKHVVGEGRFCEDELAAEYFGGLLAASRNEDGSDDRSLPLIHVVSQMSAIQIRLHYVCYYSLGLAAKTYTARLEHPLSLRTTILYVPRRELWVSMNGTDLKSHEADMAHGLFGLVRNGLVGLTSDPSASKVGEKQLRMEPTFFGSELFLRANGLAGFDPARYVTNGCDIDLERIVPVCPSAIIEAARQPTTVYNVEEVAEKAAQDWAARNAENDIASEWWAPVTPRR